MDTEVNKIMARYGNIKYCDIANGVGVRNSIFLSGCTHHCKNCFNEETWDFTYGKDLTETVMGDLIKSSAPDYIAGITLLGGDPLCGDDNQTASYKICKLFKETYPHKTIWMYTGYLYSQVKDLAVMQFVDVLVDGPFIEDQKNLMLKFRGSENQRLIDVQETRKQNKIILYNC